MSSVLAHSVLVPRSCDDLWALAHQYGLNVSRETLGCFEIYAATLIKWQKRHNLIGPATVSDIWRAHFWDSLQLMVNGLTDPDTLPVDKYIDLGSGAGFPGLVLALAGVAHQTILIEPDQKKAAFLQEVIRLTKAPALVICRRIEYTGTAHKSCQRVSPYSDLDKPLEVYQNADLVTARAVAPLSRLLGLASRLGHGDTQYLFPKGQNVDNELTEATKYWIFSVKRFHGLADKRSTILRISHVSQRPSSPA